MGSPGNGNAPAPASAAPAASGGPATAAAAAAAAAPVAAIAPAVARAASSHRAAAHRGAHAAHAGAPTTLPVTVTPTPPTTAPAAPLLTSLVYAGGLLLWALCAAVITGVFRRGIRTPDRIDSDRSAMPLLLVTALGGGAWFLTQVMYGAAIAAHFQHTHPGQHFDMDQLGAGDFAFLSTVPALVGMLVLLLGDEALGMVRRLGYAPGRVPGGVVVGLLSSVAVLPFVWGSSILLDLLYRAINFAHPAEHELLGAMKDAPQHVRVILILGACVAAPVFEELLFRAHVQTLLGRVFTSRAARETPAMRAVERPTTVLFPEMYAVVPGSEFATPRPAAEAPIGGAPPVAVGGGAAAADAPAIVLPLEYSSPRPDPSRPRRNAWLAIFATSVLFALVHPMWMAPLIFLLALCLGYVYERTGNLWACIALHAIFNTTSTITFLNM